MALDNAALVPQIPEFETPALSVDSILGLFGRTEVVDANYAATNNDIYVGMKVLTAARGVSLPLASSYATGKPFVVADESGACSATNTITITASGADTIAGEESIVMGTPYRKMTFHSNGSNLWTY